MFGCETTAIFAIFIQKGITHFKKIAFKCTDFLVNLKTSKLEYRENCILPFSHVFGQFLQWDHMQSIK